MTTIGVRRHRRSVPGAIAIAAGAALVRWGRRRAAAADPVLSGDASGETDRLRRHHTEAQRDLAAFARQQLLP